MFQDQNQHYHGRTAAAPVFFVDGDAGGLCDFGGPSAMGSLAAFLSAFHLSQAGVPAASMTSTKMADDHLSSIVKDFFDPSSGGRPSAFNYKGRSERRLTEFHG